MSQKKLSHPIHRLKGRGGEYYYLIAKEARRLKPKYLVFGLGVLISCTVSLIFSRPAQAGNETLTLETYYPAPYGIYNEFTTTGQTLLATEGGKVGIGTTTPVAKLHLMGDNVGGIYIENNQATDWIGQWPGLSIDSYSGGAWTTAPMILFRNMGGTVGSPQNTLANTVLGWMTFRGSRGGSILRNTVEGATINVIAEENFTTTMSGCGIGAYGFAKTRLTFSTGDDIYNSGCVGGIPYFYQSARERMVITSAGNVGIGTTIPKTPATGMPGNLDVNDIWVRAGSGGVGRWATDNWLVCDQIVTEKKSGSSPLAWGSNPHPECPANYARTGCAVTCNGNWVESDLRPIDNGCDIGSNDTCTGAEPVIKVTAICCRTR